MHVFNRDGRDVKSPADLLHGCFEIWAASFDMAKYKLLAGLGKQYIDLSRLQLPRSILLQILTLLI